MFGNRFPLEENIGMSITRKREHGDKMFFDGWFQNVEHWRDGKLIGKYTFPNAVTNEGKNYLFNAGFNSGTVVATGSWSMGLIDNTSFSALNVADTMTSHTGWIEFTGYSQSARPAWGQTSSTAQSVANSTPVSFDITATGTLAGIFIVGNATKGGTTGPLWTNGLFPATVPVASGDQIKLTYSVAA